MTNRPVLVDHDAEGHLISPFYGYLPTKSVCYIFVVLFGISTILHLVQAIRYRAWWLIPTAVLAAFGEVIGWSGRLWSSYDHLNNTPFLIQIVCTIIAPTPLIGAIFIAFGRMSALVGENYSRLSARLYSRIFLTVDMVALVIQSAGGGIAATAGMNRDVGRLGSNIMLAGIVFQLMSLTVFCVLMAEYFFRYVKARPKHTLLANDSAETVIFEQLPQKLPMDNAMKQLAFGICSATLFLYIRAIYRTVELADGFSGRIIKTQVYFNVLDGAMVVVAIYILTILHPARLLNSAAHRGMTTIAMAAKWTVAE
ncbi:RTA1-like protein [Daedaleopsis nitida]|nr:RTA1-like protein [Daedaleopsis nitida]